jgi:VanZ family protein
MEGSSTLCIITIEYDKYCKNNRKRRYSMNKRKTILWLAVILWLVLIFILSAQPVHKSNGLSKAIAEKIIEFIKKIFPKENINLGRFNHYLRKTAHFFAYMILGILMMNVLKIIGVDGGKRIILALLICIIYAISDELHQLFVLGRGAQVKDVIIDTIGVSVGVGLSKKCRKMP